MASTQLFITNLQSDTASVGAADTKILWQLNRDVGKSTAFSTSLAASLAPFQTTSTPAGNTMSWLSYSLPAFTLSGAVVINLRGTEVATSVNTTLVCDLSRWSIATGALVSPPFLTSVAFQPTAPLELGTGETVIISTATPTSTTFVSGDRILGRQYFASASGSTMAAGSSVKAMYGGAVSATGDTYIRFAENFGYGFPAAGEAEIGGSFTLGLVKYGNSTMVGTLGLGATNIASTISFAYVAAGTLRTGNTAVVATSGFIRFDANSNSGYQTAASSYNWQHTCTGNQRYLFTGISMLSVLGSSVSNITYAGIGLNLLDARGSASGAIRTELWGMTAPASGSNGITVTLSTSLDSIGSAVSFSGVNQSTSTESKNDNTATNVGAADATVDITTSTNNDWIISLVASNDTSITANQTERTNITGTLGSGGMSTTGPKTPAGTQTMSWTNVGATQTWTIAGIGIVQPVNSNNQASFTYSADGAIELGNTFTVTEKLSFTASSCLELGNTFAITEIISFTANACLVLGNSVLVKPSYLYTPQGSLVLGNSADVTVYYGNYTPQSCLILGNAALVKTFYGNYTTQGCLEAGNSAFATQAYVYTTQGCLVMGNTSPSTQVYTYASSGCLRTGSTAVVKNLILPYIPDGTLEIGGSFTLGKVTYSNYATSGCVQAGNTFLATLTYALSSSGCLRTGNTSSAVRMFSYAPSGCLEAGNTSPSTQRCTYTSSACLELGGSALASNNASNFAATASGCIQAGNSAVLQAVLSYAPSGCLVTGNTSTIKPNYVYNAISCLELGNTANVKTYYGNYTSSGCLEAGNTANALASLIYTASGCLEAGNTALLVFKLNYNASGCIIFGNQALITSFKLSYSAFGCLELGNLPDPVYFSGLSGEAVIFRYMQGQILAGKWDQKLLLHPTNQKFTGRWSQEFAIDGRSVFH